MTIDPKIIEFFNKRKKVFITTHVRPDGDAVGSSLALFHFLRLQGHYAMLSFPSLFPDFHKWFPGIEEALIFPHKQSRIKQFLEGADLIIAVDFNDLKRNAELGKYLNELNVAKMLIDHHPNPANGFAFSVWNTAYCAAGEAVFDLIEAIDKNALKDQKIASCLYAAIISDSGSFRFPAVTEKTFGIASKLLASGIDHSQIQRDVYDNFTERRLRFWGHCVTEKMEILEEFNAAFIPITKEDFLKFGTKASDTENLVNFPMSIKHVNISVILVEHADFIKFSFRSKDDFPVNELAEKYFNGGGHVNAAGGESKSNMETAIQELKDSLKMWSKGI